MILDYKHWMELIREVMHVGKEDYVLEFARELRYAPHTKEVRERWREVSGYADGLDLDSIAAVMVKHGWRLNECQSGPSRTVTSPDGQKFRLSPARYIAAWADEVPRLEDLATYTRGYVECSKSWWDSVDAGKIPQDETHGYDCIYIEEYEKHYLGSEGLIYGTLAQKNARARIEHRAMIQYLKARLWMEP